MSKSKKKDKQSSSALNRILIIQLIVILGLSLFITNAVSKATRQNTIEHLTSIADERAQIVKTYVQNSENTLKAFAKAKQVSDLLAYSKQYDLATLTDPETPAENKDPAGKEAQAVAQKYERLHCCLTHCLHFTECNYLRVYLHRHTVHSLHTAHTIKDPARACAQNTYRSLRPEPFISGKFIKNIH